MGAYYQTSAKRFRSTGPFTLRRTRRLGPPGTAAPFHCAAVVNGQAVMGNSLHPENTNIEHVETLLPTALSKKSEDIR